MKRKTEHPIARLVRDSLHVSIGTVPVGDMTFAYCLAAPDDYSGRRSRNWFVGVAEDGIHYVGALDVREIFVTPERAAQALAAIVRGKPAPALKAWKFASETIFPNAWQGVPIAWDLSTDYARRGQGASLGPTREEFEAWMRELLNPVYERLGPARMETLASMTLFPDEIRKIDRNAKALVFPDWAIRGESDHVERAAEFIRLNRWLAWAMAAIRDPNDLDGDDAVVTRRLMDRFGIAPAKARRMGPWCKLGDGALRLARALPVDLVPEAGDEASWDAFQTVAEVLNAIDADDARFQSLVAPSKARWVSYAERLVARFGDQGLEPDQVGGPLDFENPRGTLIVNAGDASHMVRGFASILPGGDKARDAAACLAEEAVIGDKGLAALLETSKRWHEHYEEPRLDVLAWDPVVPIWTDPETGVEIVPLADSDELLEEGRKTEGGLHHCVGGISYAQSCVRGDIRILSLRKDGQRLSTTELDMNGRGIVQHGGHRNGLPPAECLDALHAYRRQPAFLDAMARGTQRQSAPSERRVPFEIALEAWRPFLTGRWRTAAAEEFYDPLGLVPPHDSGPTP